jgi:hypothetical protein
LLGRATVGRVGVTIGALPAVFPVGFGLFEQSVLLRTIRGSKLDAAIVDAVVAFQVDGLGLGGTAGWSVLLQGFAAATTEPSAVADAARVPVTAPAGDLQGGRCVRIEIGKVSGWRFDSLLAAPW